MRTSPISATALVATCAVFAVATTTAFAEQPVWLVNGATLVGTISSETEGELNLTRLNKEGEAQQGNIKCTELFTGTITNFAGKGITAVTKLLDHNMQDVGSDNESLTGLGVGCEVTQDAGDITFCKVGGAGSVTIWLSHIPWATELELMGNSQLLDLIGEGTVAGSFPGYEIECTVLLGIKATDLCEGKTSALVSELLGTWLGTTAEGSPQEFNSESEQASCKTAGGGELVFGMVGKSITWAIEGELNRLETDVSEQ